MVTTRQRVHTLPLQLTTFIGREREVTAITDLLLKSRLVTLTGTGGIGKSRLALRVAECAENAWIAELAALAEPSLVPSAVAAAVGVRERTDVAIQDALLDSLREQHGLLILDNCEHLLEGCGQL